MIPSSAANDWRLWLRSNEQLTRTMVLFRTFGNVIGSRNRRALPRRYQNVTGSLGRCVPLGRWEDVGDSPAAPVGAPGGERSCPWQSGRERRGGSVGRFGCDRRPCGSSRRCSNGERRVCYRCCWTRSTRRGKSKSRAGRAPESSCRFYRRRSRNAVVRPFPKSDAQSMLVLSRTGSVARAARRCNEKSAG